MAGAYVDVTGDDRVLDALEELIRRGMDMQTPYESIGEYLLLAHDERFDAQQSPSGEDWQPLSSKYLKTSKKKESRGSDKILVLDTYLKSLLRYNVNTEQTIPELQFGTDRIYAAVHQFGFGNINIPARPFLGVSEDDNDEIIYILEHWFSAPFSQSDDPQ